MGIDLGEQLLSFFCSGIDDDDIPAEETTTTAVPDEMPPLEGEAEDDASRMEEVD